jgi:hypothetical protein
MRRIMNCAAICALFFAPLSARAAIIINEIAYDDIDAVSGTDSREYVELYNNGGSAVDISGWTLIGRDVTTVNPSAVVPAATSIAAGGFYVFANTGTLNVNQVVAANFLENDIESIEIRDAANVLQDAAIYESNKGMSGNLVGSGLPAEVGPGIFGNSQSWKVGNNTLVSLARYVDGRDTNNNGRDFGLRPSTPGTSNHGAGLITLYSPPDPTGQTVGTDVAGLTGSFVHAKYIDPTVVDANNPNAIPAAPITGNRAIIAWDSSGGGNNVTSNQTFGTTQGAFSIYAYLNTSPLPQQTSSAAANIFGSELTSYGIGSGDALLNLTDLGGNVPITAATLPAADTANGLTGVHWVYERTAVNGATPATAFLYLVDANDGGDADVGGNTPLDWTILQAIDISGLASNWFTLGINIDALGNGVATFNGNNYAFTTSTNLHSSAFNAGYRENLNLLTDVTPDALMRPATFTIVPEPSALALVMLGFISLGVWRRR